MGGCLNPLESTFQASRNLAAPGPCIDRKRVSMRTGPNQASSRLPLFWQRLAAALAILALVMQPLLLTVAGAQIAEASVLDEVTLSQLCLHDADGSPVAPADQQKLPANHDCLQCFAGTFHLLNAPQAVTVASADREFRKLRQYGRPLRLSSSSQYSVASPRGPPLNA